MNKYFIKKFLLSSKMYQDWQVIQKSLYLAYEYAQDYDKEVLSKRPNLMSYDSASDLQEYYYTKYPRLWHQCELLFSSHRQRVSRLKKRVASMITSAPCVFLTLTFSNDTLQSTTAKSRREYVQKYCNSLQCAYVGNIDFGAKNGREHYHVLVKSCKVDYKAWRYGSCDGLRVRLNATEEDNTKIACYIAKLTNHAIKETTRNSYIIYSRKYK